MSRSTAIVISAAALLAIALVAVGWAARGGSESTSNQAALRDPRTAGKERLFAEFYKAAPRIGEMAPGLQASLLRAIERREIVRVGAVEPVPIDVRFVAATNRDLAADVEGRFRREL